MAGSKSPLFNPFPGLRPFDTRDKFLFFGREEQTAEVLTRLRTTRFLAVVGTSGSGKSSLVRAGLIPGLHGGFMAGAGPNWRVALTRPGGDPMGNLAGALAGLELTDVSEVEELEFIRATLGRSAFGLSEFVQQSRLPAGHNLLVVVDQFEEVFRFRTRSRTLEEEAGGLVPLLLEAARQKERPIYVVLTMRSDFLGDCSEFAGLAEAINEGEYLIPRMKRDQCRLAIEGPVLVGGGRIAGRLVQRLLNDMGSDPDQLPVLQHALMRTWDNWLRTRQDDEPLDLRHYEAVGALAEALSRHADEAYGDLKTERDRTLAAALFKALTEWGTDNRGNRRPTRLKALGEIVGADSGELTPIIDCFRRPGRTFLMPPMAANASHAGSEDDEPPDAKAQPAQIDPSTIIDISHESLMRLWVRLQEWVRQEAASAAIYRRLAESARLHEAGQLGLYRDPELQVALNWQQENAPNAAWGERYAEGFARAMKLLNASREARESARRERLRRRRAVLAVISIVAALFFVLWLYAERQQRRARSGWLALRAREQVDVDPRESVLLARDAFDSDPTRFAAAELRRALLSSRLLPDPWMPLAGNGNDVSISPDGREILASVGSNAVVLAVDVAKPLRVLTGHQDEVRVAAWSPDGRTALTAGWDKVGILWDANRWTQRFRFEGHRDNIIRGTFSADSRFVVTASADGTARIWEVATGREMAQLVARPDRIEQIYCAAFHPTNNHLVALGTIDGRVLFRDWSQPGTGWEGHHPPTNVSRVVNYTSVADLAYSSVNDLAFSRDGQILATAGDDGFVVFWEKDADGWHYRSHLRHHEFQAVNRVAFSPAGRLVATAGNDGTAQVWEWATGTPLYKLRHPRAVRSVAFDSSGQFLVTVSHEVEVSASPPEGRMRRWMTGVRELPGEGDWRGARLAEFSRDGAFLLVGHGSRDVQVLRFPSMERVTTLAGHTNEVTDIAIHPRSNLVVTAGRDRGLRVWETGDWKLLTVLSNAAGPGTPPLRIDFDRAGNQLAVVHGRRTMLLQSAPWAFVSSNAVEDVEFPFTDVAFGGNDAWIATSSKEDNRAKLWLAPGWRLLTNGPAPGSGRVNDLAFDPATGRELVTASDAVRFYGLAGGSWLPLSTREVGSSNGINQVTFSRSGDALVSVSSQGRVDLWDSAYRIPIAMVVPGATLPPPLVRFTPDGRSLVVLGDLGLIFDSPALGAPRQMRDEVSRRWGRAKPRDTDEGEEDRITDAR